MSTLIKKSLFGLALAAAGLFGLDAGTAEAGGCGYGGGYGYGGYPYGGGYNYGRGGYRARPVVVVPPYSQGYRGRPVGLGSPYGPYGFGRGGFDRGFGRRGFGGDGLSIYGRRGGLSIRF